MTVANITRTRRTFRWSKEARDMVRANLNAGIQQRRGLIAKLVEISGNPRDACLRFARQLGVTTKRHYREWSDREKVRLQRLVELHPVREIARLMGRTEFSIYQMLRRMGATPTMRKDGFTRYSLAALLHVRVEEVQRWIDKGWLAARVEGTTKMPRTVITAEDFTAFCKKHREAVIGNRLNSERIEFVRTFVFPPSHADLLPVRQAKKERAAYDAQVHGRPCLEEEDFEVQDFEEESTALGLPA